MPKLAPRVTKTSAQVALTDPVFRELFGMVWTSEGFVIQNAKDYAWAILYKDVMLQALADFANTNHAKLTSSVTKLASGVERWVEEESPFNNPAWVDEMRILVSAKYARLTSRARQVEHRKHRKLWIRLGSPDPFSFERCCAVLGLPVEAARDKFEFYRALKAELGDDIRIVTYTNPKTLTKRTTTDIIDASKQGGRIQLAEYLKGGIGRTVRDKAMGRLGISVCRGIDGETGNISKNQDSDQTSETKCGSTNVGGHSGSVDRSDPHPVDEDK